MLKTLDVCRFNEYYPEWCQIISEVEDGTEKANFIQAQWDTIPFQILKEYNLDQYVNFEGKL